MLKPEVASAKILHFSLPETRSGERRNLTFFFACESSIHPMYPGTPKVYGEKVVILGLGLVLFFVLVFCVYVYVYIGNAGEAEWKRG